MLILVGRCWCGYAAEHFLALGELQELNSMSLIFTSQRRPGWEGPETTAIFKSLSLQTFKS